ncbi:MAG: malto-oligosyltrehalose trehalohydrolase [Ignavibacteriales bacterium]
MNQNRRRREQSKSNTAARDQIIWRLGLGAEVLSDGVRFRVWAPKRKSVDVVIENRNEAIIPLHSDGNGYFSVVVSNLEAGSLYKYRLDEDEKYPDPCSRFQPEGPHGPSMVIDPWAYRWSDSNWRGVDISGQVIYELHIGTFTREGTFDAAARELDELKHLGITLVEVMPVAEFPGRWNWGYDGVDIYAPAHVYGDAEAMKRFINAAHRCGIGVILDVVYNHLGPDGNYLKEYSNNYFTNRYETDWGEPLNFDGPESKEVREFFISNACYWIAEFHMDGLRLDATQDIYDSGPFHILAEISQRTREVAGNRKIVLIGENEPQNITCLAPVEKGGYGLDALWDDDFHHSAMVALTGRREAYYTDYRGEPQEFISSIKRGFLYQGQRYKWQEKPRGTPVTWERGSAFVFYTQNHDQVANSLYGERIHTLTSPSRYRAITALMLLAPETPMLFMGQEFGASSPFLFFADHCDEVLAGSIHKGRKEFLEQFPSYGSPNAQGRIPDPCALSTFERSKLNLSERESHTGIYLFHKDLLRLRREDSVISAQRRDHVDGAVIGLNALVIRFFGENGDDRLLVINLGTQFEYKPAPEPLLAPVSGGSWQLVWSSDDPRYGGPGITNPCSKRGWRLPGESAVLFSS